MSEENREIRLGREASRLLQDEALTEILSNLDQKLFQDWTRATTYEGQELVWAKHQGIQAVKAWLQSVADAGKITADRLAKK